MARLELDREDLIRDATAYVERIELAVPGEPEAVVVGFRRTNCVSFYFGPAPVYQFNSLGQLRRANYRGLLWKAEDGRLVPMLRQRKESEVQLLWHEPSADEVREFLCEMKARLTRLATAIADGQTTTLRQIPQNADILGRTQKWLAQKQDWRMPSSCAEPAVEVAGQLDDRLGTQVALCRRGWSYAVGLIGQQYR